MNDKGGGRPSWLVVAPDGTQREFTSLEDLRRAAEEGSLDLPKELIEISKSLEEQSRPLRGAAATDKAPDSLTTAVDAAPASEPSQMVSASEIELLPPSSKPDVTGSAVPESEPTPLSLRDAQVLEAAAKTAMSVATSAPPPLPANPFELTRRSNAPDPRFTPAEEKPLVFARSSAPPEEKAASPSDKPPDSVRSWRPPITAPAPAPAPAAAHAPARTGRGLVAPVTVIVACALLYVFVLRPSQKPSRPVEPTPVQVAPTPMEPSAVKAPSAGPVPSASATASAVASAGPSGQVPFGQPAASQTSEPEKESKPDEPVATLDSAARALKRGDLAKAHRVYAALLAKNPHDVDALFGMGDTLKAQGDLDGALKQYQAALAQSPSYYPALLAVADSLWEKGDHDGAAKRYQDILDRFPTRDEPARVKERSGSSGAPSE